MRIGINGFGRIGRNFTKALLERYPQVEIAAVNDLTSAAECAHLFKYDSNYGTYEGEDTASADSISIDGKTIRIMAERDPGKLPWKDLGVELVVESTGPRGIAAGSWRTTSTSRPWARSAARWRAPS